MLFVCCCVVELLIVVVFLLGLFFVCCQCVWLSWLIDVLGYFLFRVFLVCLTCCFDGSSWCLLLLFWGHVYEMLLCFSCVVVFIVAIWLFVLFCACRDVFCLCVSCWRFLAFHYSMSLPVYSYYVLCLLCCLFCLFFLCMCEVVWLLISIGLLAVLVWVLRFFLLSSAFVYNCLLCVLMCSVFVCVLFVCA